MPLFNVAKIGDDQIDIDIYGEIGESFFDTGITFSDVKEKVFSSQAKKIRLNISSLGGDVNDAFSIYDMLKSHPAYIEANIEGWTASSGTLIAMSADSVRMSENAMFLIHNAWMGTIGDAEEHRKNAELLEKINNKLVAVYKKKTKKREQTISSLMKEEKWITADEAMEMGFVDEVFKPIKAAASYDLKKIKQANLPDIPSNILNQNQNKMTIEDLKNWLSGKLEDKPKQEVVDSKINDEKMNEIMNKINSFESALEAAKVENESLKNSLSEKQSEIESIQKDIAKSKATATPIKGAMVDPEGNNVPENDGFFQAIKGLVKSKKLYN